MWCCKMCLKQSAIVWRNSHSSWHQRQEVGSKVQEIRNDLINSVWRAGKAARNPAERKHLRHISVMCPLNKTTVSQHGAAWDRGVLEWVCHLEDKTVKASARVSEGKSPWGVAIGQQTRKRTCCNFNFVSPMGSFWRFPPDMVRWRDWRHV